MKSEPMRRGVEKIHLGNGRYLSSRAISMEWFGDETEDELETLARLSFEVDEDEYSEMARLGMVDSEENSEEVRGRTNIILRTDRDLIDEEEEALAQEWEGSLEDPLHPLKVWVNLDFWEVEEVN